MLQSCFWLKYLASDVTNKLQLLFQPDNYYKYTSVLTSAFGRIHERLLCSYFYPVAHGMHILPDYTYLQLLM